MSDLQLSLSMAERQFLLDLLTETLKNKRLEEHRTRAPNYREYVLEHVALVEGLLTKVRSSAEQCVPVSAID